MAKQVGRSTSRRLKNPAIPDKIFFRIGEVARLLGVKAYVLRYWETEFPALAPAKSAKNHRVYRRSEVEAFFRLRHLLYEERYSIEGARRHLKGIAVSQSKPHLDAKKLVRLHELTQELSLLARTPIARLFHL